MIYLRGCQLDNLLFLLVSYGMVLRVIIFVIVFTQSFETHCGTDKKLKGKIRCI